MKIKDVLKLLIIIQIIVFYGCLNFPDDELIELGFTKFELDKTKSLNGKNGINGNYLIYRMKKGLHADDPALVATHSKLSIYNKKKKTKLKTITEWIMDFPEIKYFEFNKDKLFLVLNKTSLKGELEIIQYDLNNNAISTHIYGEAPCGDQKPCEWINEENKIMAFYNRSNRNKNLIHSSVYSYNVNTLSSPSCSLLGTWLSCLLYTSPSPRD